MLKISLFQGLICLGHRIQVFDSVLLCFHKLLGDKGHCDVYGGLGGGPGDRVGHIQGDKHMYRGVQGDKEIYRGVHHINQDSDKPGKQKRHRTR